MKNCTVLALLVLGFCQAQSYAQNQTVFSKQPRAYYVSAHGNDENAGTKLKPFQTLLKVNKLQLVAGDTVSFFGGTIFTGTLNLSLNATQEAPILITSYGLGRATINGSAHEAIILQGGHFILRNINAKGAGRKGGNTTDGISIQKGKAIRIENIRAEGFQKSGLQLLDCQNAIVKNVVTTHNGFCGIYAIGTNRALSKNICIRDCTAANNPGDPTNFTNHSGNGILVGFSDSVLIDHCTATNNGWDMPRKGNGPVGIWAYECNRVIIQYCISYRNKTAAQASDGGGFDLDGGMTNSLIQYCLSYDNQGSGYGLYQYSGASPWANNSVRYCISINDGKRTSGAAGFLIWNGANDSTIFTAGTVYNNVVYNDAAPVVNFANESANKAFGFYNNIFVGVQNIVDGPPSGDTFLGNVWWIVKPGILKFRTYASLKAWSNATGQESRNGTLYGLQTNPLLVGPFTTNLTNPYRLSDLKGYKLKTASPVKNKGLDLQALFQISDAEHDFYGHIIPIGHACGTRHL